MTPVPVAQVPEVAALAPVPAKASVSVAQVPAQAAWARTLAVAVPVWPVEARAAVDGTDRSALAAWQPDAAARHCEEPREPGADSQTAPRHRRLGPPRSPQTLS